VAAPLALRPGTNDHVIYTNVVERNEYRVAEDLRGAIVLDIGVHIGAFSHLALSRGAAELHGYEADRDNFEQARANLAGFADRVHLHNTAVWRSDVAPSALQFWKSTDAANAGGGTLIWDVEGPLVDAVPFDAVVDAVTRGGTRMIDLLKIDCEGAEFPILLTSTRLDRIARIVGEYHELRADLPRHVRIPGVDEFTIAGLSASLERAGFQVELEPQAVATYGGLGLFFASKR